MALSKALLAAAAGTRDEDESVDSMISGLTGADPAPAPPPPDNSTDALVADFAPKENEGGGAETPAAPATTGTTQQTPSRSALSAAVDWVRGLKMDGPGDMGAPLADPGTSFSDIAGKMEDLKGDQETNADTGWNMKSVNGLAAGGVNALVPLVGTKAIVRGLTEDRNETNLGLPPQNPYLQWDTRAQEETPGPYAIGDGLVSAFHPVNKLLAPFRAAAADGIGRGALKVLGNAATESAAGGLGTAGREYGDTGTSSWNHAGLNSAIAGLLGLVGGGVGMTAERYGARNGTPDALGLKDLDQREMRLHAAGMPNSDIDALKQSPEKFKAMSDEANRLADENFGDRFLGSYTPRDNYLVAKKAAEENRSAKDVLAGQIADAGGSARPADVAEEMRNYAGDKFAVGAPGDKDSINVIDNIANGYEDWPRLHHQEFGDDVLRPPAAQLVPPGVPNLPPTAASAAAQTIPPTAAAQGLPPPPLPAGPPPLAAAAPPPPQFVPASARPSARAPGPTPLTEQDLVPVRPSARAAPQPPDYGPPPTTPEESAMSALAAAGQPPPPPPDDLGALMEQDMLPHFEASPGNMNADQLVEQDLASGMERQAPPGPPPPRVSARYRPPADPNEAAFLMGNEVQGSGRPSARYNPATDPSAQGMPPPPLSAGPPPLPAAGPPPLPLAGPGAGLPSSGNAVAGLPPPAAGVPQAALPPPGPANSNNAAISALAAAGQPPPGPVGPMQGPPQLLQPQGPPQLMPQREVPGLPTDEVPFMEMNKRRINAGAPLEIGVPPKPENAFNRLEYSLLNDAQQAGANRAGPGWGDQWAQLKRQEGLQNPLAEAGYMHRDGRSWLNRNDLVLGGLGAGALGTKEYSDGEDSFGTGAFKTALGAAGGIAASRFLGSRGASIAANFLSKDTEGMSARLGQRVSQTPTGSLAGSLRDDMTKPTTNSLDSDPNGSAPSGYTPGQLLGRRTSAAMRANSSLFMPWAEDFQREQTDDGRAAVVERLIHTDPERFKPAYDLIMSQKNITSSDPGGP